MRSVGEESYAFEAAGIEIALFDPDLMAQIEELNRDFARLHGGARMRSALEAETADPVDPEGVGPNGYAIGYTEEGDKVEWIPDEEDPANSSPLLLRRNDEEILEDVQRAVGQGLVEPAPDLAGKVGDGRGY